MSAPYQTIATSHWRVRHRAGGRLHVVDECPQGLVFARIAVGHITVTFVTYRALILRHTGDVPVPVRIIERDPVSLSAIEAAIASDPDLILYGTAEDIRSLHDAEIAIVNLDDLASYDVTRAQMLGAPPGVELVVASRRPQLLESVRPKAVALLAEPLSTIELVEALETAKIRVLLQRMESLTTLMEAYTTADMGEGASEQTLLPPATRIEWIEANGNYVNVHSAEGSRTVRMTMAQAEADLRDSCVVRGNRKWLVNVEKIAAVHFDLSGGVQLTLQNGIELTVGRTYRESMRERLRNLDRAAMLAAD